MELTLSLDDLANPQALFGSGDKHLRQIRSVLNVKLSARDSTVYLTGAADAVAAAAAVLEKLQELIRQRRTITDEDVSDALLDVVRQSDPEAGSEFIEVYTRSARIAARTEGQKAYIEAVQSNDLTFCVGPAGTGKTYLAVAMAVSMLKRNQIKRVVLVRPAVEAGEKLGYLPGDMQAKVNPFLRPLFDAMHDMMGFDQIKRFIQNDIIEVIPLAFMRGRTLNHSAIILDEAQNTTTSQMLMFLTRLGHHSKMIVTGDDSQVDLERHQSSGLIDAVQRLWQVPGIGIVRLHKSDIVRHRLVQDIVQVYSAPAGPAVTRAIG